MRLPRPVVRAVARAKPLVPDRAWPALLTLRSLTGPGPLVATPSLRRVLVLAPHPDDESVGCGGTLALLADAGAAVTVAFATDGEATRGASFDAPEVARRRRAEAVAACRILGVREPRFLGFPDGDLRDVAGQLGAALAGLVAELRPDALFLPWFADGHEDHAAATAAFAAAGLPRDLEVWAFETWTPLPANRVVDITSVLARKESAIQAHATAHLAFDVAAIIGLNRYRSLHGLMGRGYAEAFLAAPAAAYLRLAEDARSTRAAR